MVPKVPALVFYCDHCFEEGSTFKPAHGLPLMVDLNSQFDKRYERYNGWSTESHKASHKESFKGPPKLVPRQPGPFLQTGSRIKVFTGSPLSQLMRYSLLLGTRTPQKSSLKTGTSAHVWTDLNVDTTDRVQCGLH